jgi:hypothetical protein
MTVQTMIRYRGWLRELLDDRAGEKRIYHVLMDIYPVHIDESVRLQARLLGFDVHFIPSGMTDNYRPLDCFIFGCMKFTARAEDLELARDSPERRITKEHAVQILQTPWDRLSVTTLTSQWSIYQDQEHQTDIARTRDSGQKGEVANTIKHRVFTRYEGIAIAAVLAFATEENPFVAMRKITQYTRDFEKILNSLGSPP